MRGAVVVVASLIASAIACGSFGTDTTSSTGNDAGTSASTSTGGASDGGSTSSTSSSGEPVSTFCEGASFCDEYERDDAEPTRTDYTLRPSTDSAVIIPDGHRGRAVQFRVGTGENEGDHIRYDADRTASKKIRLAFWFRPPANEFISSPQHINLAALRFDGTNPEVYVVVVLNEGGGVRLVIKDKGREYVGIDGDGFVKPANWSQVVLDVDLGSNEVALTVGANKVATTTLIYDSRDGQAVALALGPSFANVDKLFDIDFDDVRLDVE